MNSEIAGSSSFVEHPRPMVGHNLDALRYAVPLGRVLFSLIFVISAPMDFTAQSIAYAAAQGVPLASVAVPIAGVLALLGGLSVALGYKTRIGALLLVLFLIPVTLMMHRFWGIADAQAAMVQRVMFMKNVSMLGAACLLAYFGAGPLSIDARQTHDGV
jgi:putative oxidoreductase